MPWVFDPDAGGVKIPKPVQERTRQRILAHAAKQYAGKYTRLDVRFRGQFCYIDAYQEPDAPRDWPPPGWHESRAEFIERMRNTPVHLVRLRYFGDDRWGVAFYTYSHEKYELTMYPSGEWFGTPEDAFDIGAVYLQG
jgi:hypothetical protein